MTEAEAGELPELLLVSGMSGAGRSTAARALEDRGWFVVDNLPPSLVLETLAAIASRGEIDRLAVVVDVRSGRFFGELAGVVDHLRADLANLRILFLEASDEVLVHRFESNRRPHPLQGSGRLLDGIARERATLADIRAAADLVVDTSSLTVHDLRRKIDAAFEVELGACRCTSSGGTGSNTGCRWMPTSLPMFDSFPIPSGFRNYGRKPGCRRRYPTMWSGTRTPGPSSTNIRPCST